MLYLTRVWGISQQCMSNGTANGTTTWQLSVVKFPHLTTDISIAIRVKLHCFLGKRYLLGAGRQLRQVATEAHVQ
ncbi:hypothetical protein Pla144_22420 [Bythopirellula polymerisocia]|uniref:Uncharacterized protein n=1 Tax=Bythopirellula polymerisocia TaxID=2528003 RepID=A0A5C6CSU8_9BACT|nr:hypothetical protein Pla144_22420 [Bythopirellula polymerisocia]